MVRPTNIKQKNKSKERNCVSCGMKTQGVVYIPITNTSNSDYAGTYIGMCPMCSPSKLNNNNFKVVARRNLKLAKWK